MTLSSLQLDAAVGDAHNRVTPTTGHPHLRHVTMDTSIDAAHAQLIKALPAEWLMVSITLDAARNYHVIAMSQGRIDPAEAWQITGIGPSLADAMADATRRLVQLGRL